MAGLDYGDYVRLFNSGDDEMLCQTCFTEDAVMQTANRSIDGREALLAFLKDAHDGIREILHPQIVLQDSEHILAEVDIEFVATRDKPDFLFKPLKKDETVIVKFFAAYTLRGDRVCYLKTAAWPAQYGID